MYSIVGVVVTWIVAISQFDPPRVQFPDNAFFCLVRGSQTVEPLLNVTCFLPSHLIN